MGLPVDSGSARDQGKIAWGISTSWPAGIDRVARAKLGEASCRVVGSLDGFFPLCSATAARQALMQLYAGAKRPTLQRRCARGLVG